MDDIIGSIIGGVTGIFDQFAADRRAQLDRQFNAEQAALNRDFQKSEREAAQTWNLEQWNRENEYNTPAAQMKRMVEAGINPNVAISSMNPGNASGGLTTNPSSGSQASSNGPASPVTSLTHSFSTIWQNELLRQQATGEKIDNKTRGKSNELDIKSKEQAIEIQKQTSKKIEKEIESQGLTNDQARIQLKILSETTDTQIASIRQAYEIMKADEELKKAQKASEETKQGLDVAQTTNYEKQNDILEHEETIKSEQALRSKYKIELSKVIGFVPDDDLVTFFLNAAQKDLNLDEFFGYVEDYRTASQFANSKYAWFDMADNQFRRQHLERIYNDAMSPLKTDYNPQPSKHNKYGGNNGNGNYFEWPNK